VKKAVVILIAHPLCPHWFLAVSRKNNPKLLGLPGGKVESGEHIFIAAQREVFEETRCLIVHPFPIFIGQDGDFEVTTFKGSVAPGWNPKPIPGEGVVSWATQAQLEQGPFGAYNKALFAALRRLYGV
jgi:8-oxo-dGTP pyrophosphatase MutT (NUDIX family)